jgi:hypothetical protein
MPKPISIVPEDVAERDCGGILHLPDALERYPKKDLLLYNRVSSWGQAGKGKEKLVDKTHAVYLALRNVTARRLRRTSRGVEEGKLSEPRTKLVEAAEYATGYGSILVASDLSRFIRSEAYCHETNREAWPTPGEFARLHEITGGVILATILNPAITEAERHRWATTRTRRAGRPRVLLHRDPKRVLRMLETLGLPSWRDGKRYWDTSIAEVAKQFKVPPARVQRFLDAEVPVPPGRPGLRWKDLANPARAWRDLMAKGLV